MKVDKLAMWVVTTFTLFIIMLCGVFYLKTNEISPNKPFTQMVSNPEKEMEQNKVLAMKAVIRAYDETRSWPTYINKELGVSFMYPPTVLGDELVFFQKGNVLFVARASTSLSMNRDKLNLDTDEKIIAKAKEIQASSSDSYGYWAIMFKNVDAENNPDELTHIFKSYFIWKDNGCRFYYLSPDVIQSDVYNVAIGPLTEGNEHDENSPGGRCWINWSVHYKYSQTQKRIAIWNGGQEEQFPHPTVNSVDCYESGEGSKCTSDYYMAQSFRFLTPEERK